MYILQNAIENVARNKGRNILIGAIIFAIIATTVVALIINNTSATVIENYKERFSSEVSITPDMQKVMAQAQENSTDGRVAIKRPNISDELLLQFADSEYLKESIAYGSVSGNSLDKAVTAIDQSDDEAEDSNGSQTSVAAPAGGQGMMMRLGSDGNFRLYGDYWQDFTEGMRSLDSGTLPQSDNECVISSELAELNNISIGDTLTFTTEISIEYDNEVEEYAGLAEGDTIVFNDTEYTVAESFMGGRATRTITYELMVAGIYLDLTDEYPSEYVSNNAGMNRRNEILTTLNALLAERKTDEIGVNVTVTYYLQSPDLLEAFESEVRAKGLSDLFAVSTDTASYERIIKPVEGLKGISIAFMIIVIVLGAIILILLSTITIRERKYEIGVLRAMGMKKSKVALGLWAEIIAVTCICLVIGLGVGSVAAQPVTDMLIKMQVDSEGQNNSTVPGGGMMMTAGRIGGSAASNAEPLSEMKISVGLDTVAEIIIIALVLASVAGLASVSKITKYEPIKILMERA